MESSTTGSIKVIPITKHKDQHGQIKIFHLNIGRGLQNKLEKIQIELTIINPDVVIFTEHGLSAEHLSATYLNNYNLIASYSRKNNRWGGVAIYIKENTLLQYKEIETIDFTIELKIELACVELKVNKDKITVLGLYRPPCHNLDDFIHNLDMFLTEKLKSKNSKIVIMGDSNVDIVKTKNQNYIRLNNLLKEHNIQIMEIPETRVTLTTSTSIDCCFTNIDPTQIQTIAHKNYAGISDHHGIISQIKNIIKNKVTSKKKQSRSITEEKLKEIKTYLSQQNWMNVYRARTADEKYNNLISTIQKAIIEITPLITKTVLPYKPKLFWDEKIIQMRQNLSQAQNKWTTSGKLQDLQNFTLLKKQYDLEIKNQKSETLTRNIKEAPNQPKEIWKLINQERKSAKPLKENITLSINGREISNQYHVSNCFNKYFSEIGQNLDKPIGLTYKNITSKDQLEDNCNEKPKLNIFRTITKAELETIFNNIPPKFSSGIDEIPNKIVKYCKSELISPMLDVINTSILQSIVPEKMKIAIVYPKHKKDSKNRPEHYRPISILPTISKYLEKAIYNQLIEFFEQNSILSEEQHGFRKKKSINSALNQLCISISTFWEDRKQASGIFLDLEKAFDSLNRNILLQKLEELGVGGDALQWIGNYLTNRNQYTEIQHTTNNFETKTRSSIRPSNNGVPQGSVLGPLLFLAYINSFPQHLKNNQSCIMFADDTTILYSSNQKENKEEQINTILQSAINTCKDLNLKINMSKTLNINFKSNCNNEHQENSTIPMISTVSSTKFLGITIDQALNWHDHIEKLHTKLSIATYAIKRIRNLTDKKTTIIAYHALFASHLRFGIVAWGAACEQDIQKILILQKKTIRIINNLPYNDHCKPFFVENNILTLVSTYIYETIILSTKNPPPTRNQCHNHNIRLGYNHNLPQHRLQKTSKTPSYVGSKLYNLLPQNLKNLSTTKSFPYKLKQFLLQRPYYSIAEYLQEQNALT